jgi:hypothetical protein
MKNSCSTPDSVSQEKPAPAVTNPEAETYMEEPLLYLMDSPLSEMSDAELQAKIERLRQKRTVVQTMKAALVEEADDEPRAAGQARKPRTAKAKKPDALDDFLASL